MHERYRKWNPVYVRFRCWPSKGWGCDPETLIELGLADKWQHMIDRTTVRGYSHAAGAKRGTYKEGCGRSRGGFTSKIHPRCDDHEPAARHPWDVGSRPVGVLFE
jgi:hypothetical protein